jgi:hypothetical protein
MRIREYIRLVNGSLDFPRQDRVRVARDMLRDYFIQMHSQDAERFVQQCVCGGFPRRHKVVREGFKKLKRTVIWKLAGSRAEYGVSDNLTDGRR